MAYMRKVKTSSGATAVQVCWKEKGKVVKMEHIGSAVSEAGVRELEEQARKIMRGGQEPMFDLSRFDEV